MPRVLGDFTPKDAAEQGVEDEVAFGWFGTQVRISHDFGELVFTDWVEEFGTLKETDPRSIGSVKALMRRTIHPDDFEEFWRLAVAHRQNSEDLAGLFQSILASVTERPTKRPSSSSDGPVPTGPSYAAGSPLRVVDRLEAQGRPDLALAVVKAQEHLTG